jgi:hypothetical protein
LLDASARFGVQRQLFAMRVDEDVGIERDHLGSSWTERSVRSPSVTARSSRGV